MSASKAILNAKTELQIKYLIYISCKIYNVAFCLKIFRSSSHNAGEQDHQVLAQTGGVNVSLIISLLCPL